MDINRIELWGTISAANSFYDAKDNIMYKALIMCERRSGTKDYIPIVSNNSIPLGHVKISGQIRSRRNEGRLEPYVFAQSICSDDCYIDENEAVVEGYVCSDPFYKKTKTKELTQFLICIEGTRQSYLSVLVWDNTDFKKGDKIAICGRLQSRRFMKDNQPVEINELSAHKMPVVCQQICQQNC